MRMTSLCLDIFHRSGKQSGKRQKWSRSTLGLKIQKIAWQIYHLTTFEAEKEQKKRRVEGSRKGTCGVDMMGFVTYRTYTIIRGRIFRRIRRQILRAAEDLEKSGIYTLVESLQAVSIQRLAQTQR